MFDIEKQYHDNVADLHRLAGLALGNTDDVAKQLEIGMMTQEIEKAIDKAKLYDFMLLKRSQGGKKSASNMTAEARHARALKASHARKNKQKSTAGDAGKARKASTEHKTSRTRKAGKGTATVTCL